MTVRSSRCLRLSQWVAQVTQVAFVALVACTLLPAVGAAPPTSAPGSFRLGFSQAMFSDVNENDAHAAVKAWGQVVARERDVPTDPDVAIYPDRATLAAALRDERVDAVGITVLEYHDLRDSVSFNPVYCTYNSGSLTERYAVLVRRDGPIKTLADLRDRSFIFRANPRDSLAPLWLDVTLAQQALPPIARLARSITRHARLPQVLLPVFFGQADACVVSRKGFETMAELNPQLAKQLTVLTESGPLIPAVFAFRSDYAPPFKGNLLAGVRDLNKTPAGQQVLTIFYGEAIEAQSPAALEPTLELISTHSRLRAAPGEPRAPGATASPSAGRALP